MPIRLKTLQAKIDSQIKNPENVKLIHEFDLYMASKSEGNSENHRKNNLKTIIYYSSWLYKQDKKKTLFEIRKADEIIPWLQTFKKPIDVDEEEKWKRR